MVQAVDMDEERLRADVAALLAPFAPQRGNLIPILQQVQERHAYLAPQALQMVAEHLEMTACEVFGVATFYNQFRFHPPGKHQIRVCLGTACHVKGADIILENFERKLGISAGDTTPDREFSVDRVACVGCCALAPVAVVDNIVHGHVAPSKVEGLMLGFQIARERAAREESRRE